MKRSSTTPLRAALLLAALAVICFRAAAPETAAAFVLEGPHVLELTAQAMGTIATLKAEQKILVFPEVPTETPTVFDETAVYVMPQRFRSDIVSDGLRRTHLEVAGGSLTVTDGRLTGGVDPLDQYQRILRSRTRQQLMRTLAELGVEPAISSLGRVEQKVVYVVGANYPDESVPQLAVDQNTFLPVRLLLVDGGRPLAIIYRNWQKLQHGWFPFQVDFFTGDRLVRQIRVTDVQLNPTIPASLMDPEALMATVTPAKGTTREQAQDAVDAAQEAVRDFEKKFE